MATTKKTLLVHARGITTAEDFSKAKKVTVPNQSMTLQDILKRFIRRESLPVEKEGVYTTEFGDLEKMQNLDIHDRMEIAKDMGEIVKKGKKAEAEEKEKRAKAQQAPPPPEPPDKTPPPPTIDPPKA